MRRFVGLLISLCVTAWFLWFSARALPAIDASVLVSPRAWCGIVVASLSYALIVPISGWAWGGLVGERGEHWSSKELGVLIGKTQLAKYIPGNVAQYGLRFALAVSAGMPSGLIISSVIWESALAATASVVVGLVALGVDQSGRKVLESIEPSALFPGVLLAFTMTAAGLLGAYLILRILGWRSVAKQPSLTGVAQAFSAYALNYIMIGIGLYILARSLALPAELSLAAATGAFALSWVLGFLAPGPPAGIGVREGVMAALLQNTAPSHDIVAFVVLARIATLAGDALIFVVAWSLSGSTREVD